MCFYGREGLAQGLGGWWGGYSVFSVGMPVSRLAADRVIVVGRMIVHSVYPGQGAGGVCALILNCTSSFGALGYTSRDVLFSNDDEAALLQFIAGCYRNDECY